MLDLQRGPANAVLRRPRNFTSNPVTTSRTPSAKAQSGHQRRSVHTLGGNIHLWSQAGNIWCHRDLGPEWSAMDGRCPTSWSAVLGTPRRASSFRSLNSSSVRHLININCCGLAAVVTNVTAGLACGQNVQCFTNLYYITEYYVCVNLLSEGYIPVCACQAAHGGLSGMERSHCI